MPVRSDLPEGMYRRERAPDNHFEPREKLYMRFSAVTPEGKVYEDSIRCTEQSTNRSKYSQPEWVLLGPESDFLDWGYGFFRVSDIPSEKPGGAGVVYLFRPEHDPLEWNYAHTIIAAYKNTISKERVNKIRPATVKTAFRSHLRERIKVLKMPGQ